MTRVGRYESTRDVQVIEFVHRHGTYAGTGPRDRQWRIVPTVSGWRLEFWDPGDQAPTYAGTHASLAAAQIEASRPDSYLDAGWVPSQHSRRSR